MQHLYTIPGDPISYAQAHFGPYHIYDNQKNIKLIAGIYLAQQHDDKPLFNAPIRLDIAFFFQVPKRLIINSLWYTHPPTVCNLTRFYTDIGKGILFTDERIIVELHATKRYAAQPYTQLLITRL